MIQILVISYITNIYAIHIYLYYIVRLFFTLFLVYFYAIHRITQE